MLGAALGVLAVTLSLIPPAIDVIDKIINKLPERPTGLIAVPTLIGVNLTEAENTLRMVHLCPTTSIVAPNIKYKNRIADTVVKCLIEQN